MSDYLSNIIERTSGSAAVVKPRLKSLFESGGEEWKERKMETAAEEEKIGSPAVIPHPEKRRPQTIKPTPGNAEGKNSFIIASPAKQDVVSLKERTIIREKAMMHRTHLRETAKTVTSNQPLRKSVTPETVIVRNEPTPKLVVSEEHARPSSDGGAAPVVRISIGRVEVKTVLSKAQAPSGNPVRKYKPDLTLDDYLNQRQEQSK